MDHSEASMRVDYRWSLSRGINFLPPSTNPSWRPPQRWMLSEGHGSQRASMDTQARPSHMPSAGSQPASDLSSPVAPTATPTALYYCTAIQSTPRAIATLSDSTNTRESSGSSDIIRENKDQGSHPNLTGNYRQDVAVEIVKGGRTVNSICTPSSSKKKPKLISHTPIKTFKGFLETSPTHPLTHQTTPAACPHPLSAPIPVPGISLQPREAPSRIAQSNVVGVLERNGRPKILSASEQNLLGFHIPEAQLRQIQIASKKRKFFWQYSLYQGPRGEKVKVHYCKSKEKTEEIARLFLDKEVVGFDIEWKTSASVKMGTRKNVSLVQLACEERIALFHISRYPKGKNIEDLVAPSLQKIMESPNITKVGVSIKADCTRLRQFLGIESQGLFELSHLYKLVKFFPDHPKRINKTLVSLAQQVEEHLQLPLWKNSEVRNSDWSKDLNYDQVRYAASDSYAGFQLYYALEEKRKALSPVPPRPSHAELNLPIRLKNDEILATEDNPLQEDEVVSSTEEIFPDASNILLQDRSESKPPPMEPMTTPLRPELIMANDWVKQWHSNLPSNYEPRAFPAQLRAYALWYEQHHSISSTAAIMRNPPLKNGTVAVYILESLRSELFPFESERIMEVVECLPTARRSRYEAFLKMTEKEGR